MRHLSAKTTSSTAAPSTGRADNGAFALIDLLIALAVLAVLGCLSLGAASASKSSSQTLQCMANGSQMIKAWTLYALDNQNYLAPNCDDGSYGNWLGGAMSSAGSYQDPTNYGLLNNTYRPAASAGIKGGPPSSIGGYIVNYKTCHCPADPSAWDPNAGVIYPRGGAPGSLPRVRSYSMNGAVGTGDGITSPINKPVYGPWLTGSHADAYNQFNTYGSLNAWTNPGPAGVFVITDEDPSSINDAVFSVSCSLPDTMIDWPASYHDLGSVFSFADGHVLLKHWVDPRTYAISFSGNNAPGFQPSNPDIEWLRLHTSADRDGTPLPVSITPSP